MRPVSAKQWGPKSDCKCGTKTLCPPADQLFTMIELAIAYDDMDQAHMLAMILCAHRKVEMRRYGLLVDSMSYHCYVENAIEVNWEPCKGELWIRPEGWLTE